MNKKNINNIPKKWQNGCFLIAYKGGGYDGCFWEWNFALIKDNKFFNLYATGYKGIKKINQLENLNDENDYETYNLNNDDECNKFVNEMNEGLVLGIADILLKDHTINLKIKCDICEKTYNYSNGFSNTYYNGNGGIGFEYHGFACIDCYNIHTCDRCNEFDEDTIYRKELDETLCNYCYEDNQKKN